MISLQLHPEIDWKLVLGCCRILNLVSFFSRPKTVTLGKDSVIHSRAAQNLRIPPPLSVTKTAPICQIAGYRTVVAEFVADLSAHHSNKVNYLTVYGVGVIILT